jgi:hypothetical protein
MVVSPVELTRSCRPAQSRTAAAAGRGSTVEVAGARHNNLDLRFGPAVVDAVVRRRLRAQWFGCAC